MTISSISGIEKRAWRDICSGKKNSRYIKILRSICPERCIELMRKAVKTA